MTHMQPPHPLQHLEHLKPAPHPQQATQQQAPVRRPLPEASEEEWQRRMEKRRNAVDIVKASSEYLSCAQTQPCGDEESARWAEAMRMPDPEDRLISKRAWEEEIRQWRTRLRQWCPANGQDPSP